MTFLQSLDITSFLLGMTLGIFSTVAVVWMEIDHLRRKHGLNSKGELK